MAVDKLVDSTQLDSDLTSVANAIRTKGGTSAQLAFPNGFVSAIGNIPSGGGGIPVDEVASGISGAISLPNTTIIRSGAFLNCLGITSFDAPNAIEAHSFAFYNCSGVLSASFPKLAKVYFRAFNGFGSEGMSLFLPGILDSSAFPNSGDIIGTGGSAVPFADSNYSYLVLPNFSAGITTYFAANCKNLLRADLGNASSINQNAFNGSSKLNVLVLRRSSCASLSAINALSDTPFASGKSGGTLYVPSSLISSYQSATNWSTILGYSTNSILPIEGSIYETQYADGTPIE